MRHIPLESLKIPFKIMVVHYRLFHDLQEYRNISLESLHAPNDRIVLAYY
jgi:hypothetical protein